MREIHKIIAGMILLALLFSGCASKPTDNKNGANGKEDKEINKYIDSEPGRLQMGDNSPADAVRITCTDYDDYRCLIAQEDASAKEWLLWEQFSALGEFYEVSWWKGNPSLQCRYVFTNPKTNREQIYYVGYNRIPDELGDISIKEYYQWYFGRDYVEVPEYKTSDFANLYLLKPKSEAIGMIAYVSDELRIDYDSGDNTANQIHFVYDKWQVTIIRDDYSAFDPNEDPEIIQRLLNVDTYMDAIKELMNPENAK